MDPPFNLINKLLVREIVKFRHKNSPLNLSTLLQHFAYLVINLLYYLLLKYQEIIELYGLKIPEFIFINILNYYLNIKFFIVKYILYNFILCIIFF